MSLDIPVTQFIGTPRLTPRSPLRTNPALGIELEYEQCNMDFERLNHWSVGSDGSLRNEGIELVSVPLAFDTVADALLEAEHAVENSACVSTERCGLHTHINMRPYTVGQVWSFAALYALIEPTLFASFAQGREESVFGVPLWTNTPQVTALYRDICHIRSLRDINHIQASRIRRTCKYSAMNVSALATLGTIEMRQPYCSNDFTAISIWTEFIMRLHDLGVSYNDPEDVLALYEQDSLSGLQEHLFGTVYDINDALQEKAEDAAYFISGYAEPQWEELDWHLQEIG